MKRLSSLLWCLGCLTKVSRNASQHIAELPLYLLNNASNFVKNFIQRLEKDLFSFCRSVSPLECKHASPQIDEWQRFENLHISGLLVEAFSLFGTHAFRNASAEAKELCSCISWAAYWRNPWFAHVHAALRIKKQKRQIPFEPGPPNLFKQSLYLNTCILIRDQDKKGVIEWYPLNLGCLLEQFLFWFHVCACHGNKLPPACERWSVGCLLKQQFTYVHECTCRRNWNISHSHSRDDLARMCADCVCVNMSHED